MPPVERHHRVRALRTAVPKPARSGRWLPPSARPGAAGRTREVHLHLVRGAAQGRDPAEGLTGQVGQLVDQVRQLGDGQRLDPGLGVPTAARYRGWKSSRQSRSKIGTRAARSALMPATVRVRASGEHAAAGCGAWPPAESQLSE